MNNLVQKNLFTDVEGLDVSPHIANTPVSCSCGQSGEPPSHNGKYQIIYADPPWKVSMLRNGKDKARQFDHYQTMKTKDIAAMPISGLCDDNSIILLWSTNTFLEDAFFVLREWGFKYHCTITWDKKNGITMRGFHRVTEFLLFGYKGAFPSIGTGKPIKTLVQFERGKHSQKPNEIRNIITEKFGELRRLELFARQQHEGWDVFGNEVPNSIKLNTGNNYS